MLVLTPAAVAVVNSLTARTDRPDGAGLRISSDTGPVQEGLQVTLAPGPSERDLVVADSGARVFVDPHARSFLEDKVLDAEVDEKGGAHFMLGTQSRNGNHPGP
jgi:iron-sulfur cluster assembly protein